MLTLHYNGYDIPTGKDFSVRLSWKNPACFFNEIPGNAGLGIDIPVNDYSKAIFGSPHRFEKYGTGSDRKFSGVDIRFNGVLLMSGTLNITNATSEVYSAWLQSQVGVIGEEQREKFINELITNSETEPWDEFNSQTFENKGTFDDDEDDYCTGQFINRRFWDDIGKKIPNDKEEYYNDEGEEKEREAEISELAAWHRDNYDWEINSSTAGIVQYSLPGAVVSPFLFLKFLLRNVLKRCAFFIDSERNCFDDLPELKNLAFYNNFNIMVPTFTTSTEYKYEKDEATGVIHPAEVKIVKSMVWELQAFNYINLIPRVKMKDFILGIQNFLNIVFVFDNYNKVAIIDREAIISGDCIDLSDYFLGDWVIGERKNLTLKFTTVYDPDDSITADNYHDLSDRQEDIGNPIASVSELENIASPEFGEIRHCEWEDEYWEYKWDVYESTDDIGNRVEKNIEAWIFVSSGPQPEFYGDGETLEEIKSEISTLYSHWRTNGLAVLQKGSFTYMRTLWNNFSPRLFWHMGAGVVDVRNNTYNMALRWYGDDGLLEMRWKKWAAFWRDRLPVEGEFDLPLNVLYYVVNNITSKFKTVHGEFIIEEMEVEFGMNMIGRTRIKGYKI